jgi:hypothetical protein
MKKIILPLDNIYPYGYNIAKEIYKYPYRYKTYSRAGHMKLPATLSAVKGGIKMNFNKIYGVEYDNSFMFWGFLWLVK